MAIFNRHILVNRIVSTYVIRLEMRLLPKLRKVGTVDNTSYPDIMQGILDQISLQIVSQIYDNLADISAKLSKIWLTNCKYIYVSKIRFLFGY